jgi:hypothetical protein
VASFEIKGVEPSDSASRNYLISKMDHREMGCEDERPMELAQTAAVHIMLSKSLMIDIDKVSIVFFDR